MKLLIDTNVLVAGSLMVHPAYSRIEPYLKALQTGKHQGLICAHALAETYAVLTAMPISPKITPQQAKTVIESAMNWLTVIPLTVKDYQKAVTHCASLELASGAVYDLLHGLAARKANADHLLTLNAKHFKRFGEDIAKLVKIP